MNLDTIKELLSGVSPEKLLPDLDNLFSNLDTLMRIAVMIGPLCILGFGLFFLLAAPKEANHSFGYRCYWGMSSVQAWQFTQKIAGLAWTVMGLILSIVMAVKCNGFASLAREDMIVTAVKALLWQGGLVIVSMAAIHITVIALFDRKGYRRRRTRR